MSDFIVSEEERQLTKIKFLLRRIENGIEAEEAGKMIVKLYKENIIDLELLNIIINKDMIKKAQLFNDLSAILEVPVT